MYTKFYIIMRSVYILSPFYTSYKDISRICEMLYLMKSVMLSTSPFIIHLSHYIRSKGVKDLEYNRLYVYPGRQYPCQLKQFHEGLKIAQLPSSLQPRRCSTTQIQFIEFNIPHPSNMQINWLVLHSLSYRYPKAICLCPSTLKLEGIFQFSQE